MNYSMTPKIVEFTTKVKWDKLSQKIIDLIGSLGYAALSVASHSKLNSLLVEWLIR